MSNKTKIVFIAEAGVNHNGEMRLSKKLVDVASEAGADFIKFQTFKAEKLVSKNIEKADYQKRNSNRDETQYEMLKKLELNEDNHEELIDYCKYKKIQFLSTAFDIDSINLLSELGIPLFKIPSSDLTNVPYLRHIAKLKKPTILSSGMSTLEEVGNALNVLLDSGLKKEFITILHCTTDYPTSPEDVNLKAMLTIKKKFGVKVGYSDHTLGIEVSIAAAAMGAQVIEKHFTMDRNLEGPDHAASLEPKELKTLICAIRNIEHALGDGIKKPSKSEQDNMLLARKSITAKTAISVGERFTEDNLCTKRPGNGISPTNWDQILNKKSKYSFEPDDLIRIK